METSILNSVKRDCGIDPSDTSFDETLIRSINSAFMRLQTLGVGPQDDQFRIEDNVPTWDEFIGDTPAIDGVKDYVALKVRLRFDPPTNSSVLSAYQDQIAELEWILNAQVDPEDGE